MSPTSPSDSLKTRRRTFKREGFRPAFRHHALLPLALGALVLGAARPATGQTIARATVDVGLKISPVAGATQLLPGARLWYSLSDNFRFGGGVWAMPQATRSGTIAGSGLEMDFGYGGIGVELSGLWQNRLAARTHFGAGSATIIDQATGARVDSESFMFLEPTLATHLPLTTWLQAEASAGYRLTFGVGELARVESNGLRGWVIGVGLRAR